MARLPAQFIMQTRRGRLVLPILVRSLSSGDVSVKIEQITENSKMAVISMNRSPVNSLSIPFARQLCASLRDVESTDGVDAMVINSSISGQFSAGLDFKDIYGQPPEHIKEFWSLVQEVWLQIYSSRLATVAFINGHCLAAGIILAAGCDYRFAVEGSYSLGIPAARVGMVAPYWVIKLLAQIIGRRRTEYAIQTGEVFTPERALEIGLVDTLSTAETANDNCLEIVKRYLSVSQMSRSIMKQEIRQNFIDEFKRKQSEDLENFVKFVTNNTVQKNIGEYFKTMKKS